MKHPQDFLPMPPFILLRISKKAQKDRLEKQGRFYLSPDHTYMKREVQYGEVVTIGAQAHFDFPEVQKGDTLLIHYFVSGKEKENSDEGRYRIGSDETFNYYLVTTRSHAGRQNETYGVVKDGQIIPHKEFIFLELPVEEIKDKTPDEYINDALQKTDSGLVVFKNWKEDREKLGGKMKELQNQVKELSKSQMTPEVVKGIEAKEREMNKISEEINKKRYEPFVIAASNPILDEWFGKKLNQGDTIHILNIAAKTTIEYLDKEYIVAKNEYIGFIVG